MVYIFRKRKLNGKKYSHKSIKYKQCLKFQIEEKENETNK